MSRAVTQALRHTPGDYRLTLDPEGWVSMKALAEGLQRHGIDDVTPDRLASMIESSIKKRHEIVGDRIRATYGHSIEAAVALGDEVPPEVLYHGTTQDAAAAIAIEGLTPMNRQHVHLSPDPLTALEVARRHGAKVTLLRVRSRDARSAGVRFEKRGDLIWVSTAIDPEFISVDLPAPR